MQYIRYVIIISLTALAGAIWFSPYRPYQDAAGRYEVRNVIEIHAPVDAVWQYLGHSANASDWSVYVDHIVPLNPDAVPDGSVGSLRRCFQNPDEQGLRWDEEIVIVEPLVRRRLTIFNHVNFPMQSSGLATEQQYARLPSGGTRLTFTVFYPAGASWWDALKTKLGGYQIDAIFVQNMQNIKRICEAKYPLNTQK
jgi:Polyketide cyclase / dehydrase and lipid transport